MVAYDHMDIMQKTLKDFGLTETEITIYLAGLRSTALGVRDLERETKLKRPTIYHALNTLAAKGLTANKGTHGRLLFTMTRPEHLERVLNKKIERLQDQKDALAHLIPLLPPLGSVTADSTRVEQYDGIEGVKTVIDDALYCRSRHWDILAPKKNFLSDSPEEYIEYFKKKRDNHQITTRALWEKSPAWRRLSLEERKIRQPRFLPERFSGRFHSLMIIYDESVTLISSYTQATAVRITSRELKETMTTLFEALWESAEEISDPPQRRSPKA